VYYETAASLSSHSQMSTQWHTLTLSTPISNNSYAILSFGRAHLTNGNSNPGMSEIFIHVFLISLSLVSPLRGSSTVGVWVRIPPTSNSSSSSSNDFSTWMIAVKAVFASKRGKRGMEWRDNFPLPSQFVFPCLLAPRNSSSVSNLFSPLLVISPRMRDWTDTSLH